MEYNNYNEKISIVLHRQDTLPQVWLEEGGAGLGDTHHHGQ